MTAEIAILNQSGVAMAADSAVTLGLGNNEKKIYNTANKLFMLSKIHPVGIMIYNSAKLMGIDWEIIIKQYRKKLGANKFNTLKEYSDDFLNYIETFDIINEDIKLNDLGQQIYSIIRMLQKNIEIEWNNEVETNHNMTEEKAHEIIVITIDRLISVVKDDIIERYTFESFRNSFSEVINMSIGNSFSDIDKDLEEKIFKLIYHNLASFTLYKNYTGVVISGYGESEIFPSIINILSKGLIPGCYIYKTIDYQSISLSKNAIIIPFAQSEMVSSFMDGIDPDFMSFISKEMRIIFDNINNICPLAKDKTDLLQNKFHDTLNKYKRSFYVDPILNVVGSLPKVDLADMAEALVNLTAFKRHVSSDAETVGGPTDVAIISKGDGFIWAKRKHYFDPKYNQHFFNNYYKEV